MLKNAFAVLKKHAVSHHVSLLGFNDERVFQDGDPALLGASVLSPADVYRKLVDFKTRLVSQRRLHESSNPRLYFVKVDVKACFDTINQEKLLTLLKNVIDSVGHLLNQYEHTSMLKRHWPCRIT